MPRPTRPTPPEIARLLARQAPLPFTYPDVGATRGASPPPPGWAVDHHRARLGSGRATFGRAVEALRRWAQFRIGWVDVEPAGTPIAPGSVIAIVARGMGLWWANAARIAYVVDEPDRFGFAYGTLPHHIARGEERFLVERDPLDDSAWFDILAFSRPRALAARVGYPFVRHYQHRFAEHSLEAMARSVGGGSPRTPDLAPGDSRGIINPA